jgi:putative transposase
MKTPPLISYKRHRYPAAVISQCVWLYFRFALNFKDVELMMAQRSVDVSYENIRAWCEKFGRQYAQKIRHQRGPMCNDWNLDEVYLKINGECQHLWCAVDQEGQVLDILVKSKRDKAAAERFFKKVLHYKRQAPRQVVTNRLGSYNQPCADILPDAAHLRGIGAKNRAENSHQPTRLRECRSKRFKSAGQAQRFVSTFSEIGNLFALSRHSVSAASYRELLNRNLVIWASVTQAAAVQ